MTNVSPAYQIIHADCYGSPRPDATARASLRPGQGAKLLFAQDGYTTERMWVIVTRRLDDGGYVGALVNDPVALPIARGAVVRFAASEIVDIYDPKA